MESASKDDFWSTPIELPPFTFKRILNYLDDTASPLLFYRNRLSHSQSQNSLSSSLAESHLPAEFFEAQAPIAHKSPTGFKSAAERIAECLYSGDAIDLDKLRKLSWSGIPAELRPICWKVLMGYLPNSLERHANVLARKRREYRDIVEKYFGKDAREASQESLSDAVKTARNRPNLDLNDVILHQISIDVPRTCPECPLFQIPQVQQSLLRILYCWSIRRPATGYVQGINDLVTPLYDVFISEHSPSHLDSFSLDPNTLFEVEADTFWCLSNLLDSIQDNYTFNQSGIYRQVNLLRTVAHRMDPVLVNHLEAESVQFVQFAFRWMNCLLLREFRLKTIERLWDSYLAEGIEGFKTFHAFVCAAFLLRWRRELQFLEFQDIIVFLQTPPTSEWTDREVELLVAEAFVLKNLFQQ